MSKKEHIQNVEVAEEQAIEIATEDEQVFEADAYGTPKLDQGADVTVSKPVGYGGPVPIVAPKHTTIQLQPIVVPLAVVPYMTSDSNVLRTDNKQSAQYNQYQEEETNAPEFEAQVKKQKKAKSYRKVGARISSLLMVVLFGLFFVPFILSHYYTNIGALDITQFDVIGIITNWIQNGFYFDGILLLYDLVAVLSGVSALISIIGLIVGKFAKSISGIFSFIDMISFIGLIIYWSVTNQFVLAEKTAFVVLLTISCVTFVLSILGSAIVSRFEDKEETAKVKEI